MEEESIVIETPEEFEKVKEVFNLPDSLTYEKF